MTTPLKKARIYNSERIFRRMNLLRKVFHRMKFNFSTILYAVLFKKAKLSTSAKIHENEITNFNVFAKDVTLHKKENLVYLKNDSFCWIASQIMHVKSRD